MKKLRGLTFNDATAQFSALLLSPHFWFFAVYWRGLLVSEMDLSK